MREISAIQTGPEGVSSTVRSTGPRVTDHAPLHLIAALLDRRRLAMSLIVMCVLAPTIIFGMLLTRSSRTYHPGSHGLGFWQDEPRSASDTADTRPSSRRQGISAVRPTTSAAETSRRHRPRIAGVCSWR